MKKKIIIIVLAVLVLSGIGAGSYFGYQHYLEAKRIEAELARRRVSWELLRSRVIKEAENFQGETGIFIKDLKTGWIIQLNQDKMFAAASVVKVPIMAACFYAYSEGKLGLSSLVSLQAGCKTGGSGKLKNYPVGWQCSVEDLIAYMIKESDNTASNMLIDILGFSYLNDVFKKCNLRNTSIARKMMDFSLRDKGVENYTTAQDLAYLLEAMYWGKFINSDISSLSIEILKQQKINDRIPANLPAATIVAHKTGLERGICHDAGIVYTQGGDFLICILTKHGNKTSYPVKSFIAQIARQIYNYTVSA